MTRETSKPTISPNADVLPDDEVCGCLHETGGRQVRLYERCLRCGAFMEADYIRDLLAAHREEFLTGYCEFVHNDREEAAQALTDFEAEVMSGE